MNADFAHLCADEAQAETAGSAGKRIFNAARELFYRQGIRAVGVEAIAAAAGTTKMSLYRNFASKDALVAAVLRDEDQEFWTWWDSVIAPFEGQPRKQIEQLFRAFETVACEDESCRGCPIANASVEIIEDEHPGRKVVLEHHEEMLRRLRELAAEMGARDPDRLGDALMLLMGGSFVARLVFDGLGPVESVADIARVLLDSKTLGAPVE
jgi:AcrR family transcriptional regulator